jgi:hypothetical protein
MKTAAEEKEETKTELGAARPDGAAGVAACSQKSLATRRNLVGMTSLMPPCIDPTRSISRTPLMSWKPS